MTNVLFLCGRNRKRSPTAEEVFSGRSGIDVASAGLSRDAESPATPEMIEWADIIFVMEKLHRTKLVERFRVYLRDKQIICLNIADKYDFMDDELVRMLKTKVEPVLRRL